MTTVADEIREYLQQLAPHVKQRRAARLLREALAEIEAAGDVWIETDETEAMEAYKQGETVRRLEPIGAESSRGFAVLCGRKEIERLREKQNPKGVRKNPATDADEIHPWRTT